MSSTFKYVLYIRKSTDEEKRQIMSLDAQIRELRDFAKRERLTVVDIVQESKTAKEPGRPLFNKALERIENGEANGLLCWDIDRLYRNPVDEGRVRWMLQRSIIQSIRTPVRSYSPSDAGLLMAVEGGRASDFIIHHKRDVMRGIREKLLRGEWPGGTRPLGYIYDHSLHNIVPDLKKAKIVQEIFEEYSSGRHGLTYVSERLADLGIRTKTGKLRSKFLVHRLLSNPLYIGVMIWNGEAFEGKYKPIITAELFAKVQKVMKVRNKPRKKRNGHNFPFCGIFNCSCGSMMTAQWAKGNGGLYRYYRCTRKGGFCSERYVQEKEVVNQCLAILKPLGIEPSEAAYARSVIDRMAEEDGRALEATGSSLQDEVASVQAKLNKLTQGYLSELIDEESYEAAKAELVTRKAALKQRKGRLQRSRSGFWIEPAHEFINALESAAKAQEEKSPQEISLLVQKIGTNRLISGKRVTFGFSQPYDFTLEMLGNSSISDPENNPSRRDGKGRSPLWCTLEDLNL